MTEARKVDLVASRHALITQRLRLRRDDLGLTQKQIVTRLARCGLQTTNRALSSLEHGSGLDVAKLPELATALDCTVTYLLGLTEDPHRWQPDDLDDPAAAAPTRIPPSGRPPGGRRVAEPAAPPTSARDGRGECLILGAFVPESPRRGE